jgi:hypothetical protein
MAPTMQLRRVLALLPVVIAAACSSTAPTDDIGAENSAVSGFPGCTGLFNTQPSPTGAYYATDFGCSSNPVFSDPGDTCGSASCIQSAFQQGLCASGESNASCQRAVNWYSIGGASYGCGARLQVTNPANGKSVVVIVLDNGPSCTVENNAGFWVLDVSYPTIMYLFGSQEGYSDHAHIQVSVVGASTPLGPTTGSTSSSGSDAGGYGSCTTASGATGTCIATSACAAAGGTTTAGDCQGPSNIECCTAMKSTSAPDAGAAHGVDSGTSYGACKIASGAAGECIDRAACASQGGTSTAGDCPGPSTIECCTATPGGSDAGATPIDHALDAGYGACKTTSGVAGACIDTATCAAHGGTSMSGDCPGPAHIECCTGAT